MSKTHNKISNSREDKIFNIIIHIIIAALLVIIAYPLIFVLSSSFSSKDAVTNVTECMKPEQTEGGMKCER